MVSCDVATLFSQIVSIMQDPPETGQRTHRNSGISFSAVHSNLETEFRLRTVGSCGYHRKGPRQSGLEISLPLYGPAEVDYLGVLHLSELVSSFFFIKLPPCIINRTGSFSRLYFRGSVHRRTRQDCRVAKIVEICVSERKMDL